jgi:hypothetical protein
MTNFRKLSTAAAALTLGTVLSTGAYADMNCGDFNAMDADGQKAAMMEMQGPDGGREEARDEATGEDATEEGVGTEQADSNVEANDDSGQEGQQDMARGDDEEYMSAMVEHCKGGDDLMMKDARHPSEENKVE